MNNRPGSLRGMPVKGQQFSRKPINKKATLLRLLKYMMQFKWLLILALALTLFSNSFALIGPRLSGSAIDCIAAPGGVDFGGVAHYALLMLAFYLPTSRVWAVEEETGRWTVYGEGRKGGAVFAERLRQAAGLPAERTQNQEGRR